MSNNTCLKGKFRTLLASLFTTFLVTVSTPTLEALDWGISGTERDIHGVKWDSVYYKDSSVYVKGAVPNSYDIKLDGDNLWFLGSINNSAYHLAIDLKQRGQNLTKAKYIEFIKRACPDYVIYEVDATGSFADFAVEGFSITGNKNYMRIYIKKGRKVVLFSWDTNTSARLKFFNSIRCY